MDADAFGKAFLTALKDPEIRKTLGDIVTETLKNEIVLLRKELKTKDTQIKQLQTRIESLESNNDAIEQYTRRNSLRVFGLPEEEGEDTASRTVSFINDTMKIEPPISVEDFDRVHRVSRKATAEPSATPRPRAIIIKFATYRARHRVISKKASLKNTEYYINEDLTSARSTMLYKARMMKRQGHIKDVWTHDGAIVIKDKNGRIKYAHSLLQCDNLFDSVINSNPTS